MRLLRAWHTHLSAETRRSTAYEARCTSYAYTNPSQARNKRFMADVQGMRRVVQDHRPGRYLDAAFGGVTGRRALHALPTTSPWKDRASVVACILATAVRQVLDIVACLVGVIVGAARYGLPVANWGTLRVGSHAENMRRHVDILLQDYLAKHLADAPLQDGNLSHQFTIDHNRQSITLGKTPWEPPGDLGTKTEQLLAFCDGNVAWAQAVSLALTQFPANAAFEALTTHGRMGLRDLGVVHWNNRPGTPGPGRHGGHRAARDEDTIWVRASCAQHPAMLMIGLRDAQGRIDPASEDALHCDGTVRFALTLRIPRPDGATLPRIQVAKFEFAGNITEPPADVID